MLNNPWIIAIVSPLIVAVVVAVISLINKRDLDDLNILLAERQKINSNSSKYVNLSNDQISWQAINYYKANNDLPIYYYPNKYWFRQKIVCGDSILVLKKKRQLGNIGSHDNIVECFYCWWEGVAVWGSMFIMSFRLIKEGNCSEVVGFMEAGE